MSHTPLLSHRRRKALRPRRTGNSPVHRTRAHRRALLHGRALVVLILTVVFLAALVAAEVVQAHPGKSPASRAVLAEPVPVGPTSQPWIEAPQGQPGTPPTVNPTPPPVPSSNRPGQRCIGQLKTVHRNDGPHLMCEYTPGKWVEVKPDSVREPPGPPGPGVSTCRGKTKTIIDPSAPAPLLVCEDDKGRQTSHPAYGNNAPASATVGKPCGVTDWGCQAKEAVTGWFRDLVKSSQKPAFKLLSATILGTPEIASKDMSRARELWGTSQVIANTCFVLLITIGGIALMAGQTLPGDLTPKQLLPRLVVGFLAANLSLVVIGYGISFANGLARAFLDAGGRKINPTKAGEVVGNGVQAAINTMGLFAILLSLVAIILAVIVGLIYVARLAITMVLIVAAPLALMFHALPFTEGIARFWWRSMIGMLAIQVCQSLVFITALQLLFTQSKDEAGQFYGVPTTKADAIDLLLVICLLWIMIRIPAWIGRSIWQQAQPRILSQMVKTFLIYRTVGRVLGRSRRVSVVAVANGGTGRRNGKGNGRHRKSGGAGPGGSSGPNSGPSGGPGGGPGAPGGGGPNPHGGGHGPNRRQPRDRPRHHDPDRRRPDPNDPRPSPAPRAQQAATPAHPRSSAAPDTKARLPRHPGQAAQQGAWATGSARAQRNPQEPPPPRRTPTSRVPTPARRVVLKVGQPARRRRGGGR